MNISLITDKNEKRARVAWSLITEPQDGPAAAVVSDLGYIDALDAISDPKRAAELGERDSELQAGIARWTARIPHVHPDEVLLQAGRDGVHLVDPLSIPGLGDLAIAPHVLYVRGDAAALAAPGALTWAGARASSAYGEHVTNELVAEIAAEGTPVHTGGAYGIDAAALRRCVPRCESADAPSSGRPAASIAPIPPVMLPCSTRPRPRRGARWCLRWPWGPRRRVGASSVGPCFSRPRRAPR